MDIAGILMATGIVGAVGLFVGLFLGVAGIKFKVDVDERASFREITAAAAVTLAVLVWRRRS